MSFDVEWSYIDNGEPTAADLMFASFISAADLDSIPEPEPLIHKTLFMNSLAWLIGRPGHGKSFIAIDLAAHIALGETWAGCPTKKGKVMYLVAEGGSGIRERIRTWEDASGQWIGHQMMLKTAAVQVMDSTAWAAFVEATARLGPVLVVVDTQARVTVGMEENSAKEMGMFVSRLDHLRLATGACVLVVHHQGRGDGEHMRGSTAMDGAADTVIGVKKVDTEVRLECLKQKEAAAFEPLLFRLVEHAPSAYASLISDDTHLSLDTPMISMSLKRWWDSDETDWVSASYLVETEIFAKATFHRIKKSLIRRGAVEEKGEGQAKRYRLLHEPYNL